MENLSAIEYLVKELFLEDTIYRYNVKVIEQAKEMHKNEIIESYCKGCFDISKDENIFPRETSEEYYKKTFINE